LVPIHPQLKKLGLLGFWEHLTRKREKRLFPELPYHEKNKYGYQMQKWFNGTYTNKKNCDIRTPNTSFHSLRHTFETILANKVEMPVHKLEMMMGQKPSGGVSTGRYIKPIDLQERYKYVKQVSFDECIDFGAIKPWRQQAFVKRGSSVTKGSSSGKQN
jgi:integrase